MIDLEALRRFELINRPLEVRGFRGLGSFQLINYRLQLTEFLCQSVNMLVALLKLLFIRDRLLAQLAGGL